MYVKGTGENGKFDSNYIFENILRIPFVFWKKGTV